MPLWSRIVNVFRVPQLSREIDEELASHIDEAIERGRDPVEARRAFGPLLRRREESQDLRLIGWLDSLGADVVFGWRQLRKRKVTSAAAILSLGLAIGSCVAAFRIIDALLVRPLPVRDPERLHLLARQGIGPDGKPRTGDSFEYPLFEQMRPAAKDQADLIAISYAVRRDLTYGSDEEMEKAYAQYVSGSMFDRFGVKPALGRLLGPADDLKPGAHPLVVLSYDYWTHRFARDPNLAGRTLRLEGKQFEIIGVADPSFTGTEPGTITDLFLPMMMNVRVTSATASWLRIFVQMHPTASPDEVRDRLNPVFHSFSEERAKEFRGWPKERVQQFLRNNLVIRPAAAGVSGLQADYKDALVTLAILVALVLLIACANVANLMTAQAAARAREMALRVAIGAGRRRLIQLVLVESGLIALFGTGLGAAFAWWSAPLVVSLINPPDHPVRLILAGDLRVLAFGAALAIVVTTFFGLGPALRASETKPSGALRGGEAVHARHRAMHPLIAVQVAFCFLVLFDTGLFVTTFERLSKQPTGFAAEGLVNVVTQARTALDQALWEQVAGQLRTVPGVQSVALGSFPLLSGSMEGGFVSVGGEVPGGTLVRFLGVSPGWFDTLRIGFVDGRDFRGDESTADVAIVNQSFALTFFNGEDPVGKTFETNHHRGHRLRVIGFVRDARYQEMSGPIPPVVYEPLRSSWGAAFAVRVSEKTNPLALASTLRHEITRARPGLLVSRIVPQTELVEQQTIRERLLAMLASFFAMVALLLAGVGLYGVLDYSVLERRREIGIRLAIGAPMREIAREVTVRGLAMVALGSVAGVALGLMSFRYIESLVYGVKATDPARLAFPALIILLAALLASFPAAIRALRIDPADMLRSE